MSEDQGAAAPHQSSTQGDPVTGTPSCPDHHQPVDIEEGFASYRRGGFHPVYIGDIYHGRYEVLNKIGFGVHSTVWLVRDLKFDDEPVEFEFLALKVLSAECYGQEKYNFEKEVLTHLGDPAKLMWDHANWTSMRRLVDDFELEGPNGSHICQVFVLMSETLRRFAAGFPGGMLPADVMKTITLKLALALDFAFRNDIIHTDLKLDDVYVRIEEISRIEPGYLAEIPIPEQNREEEHYTVIPSRPLRLFYVTEANNEHLDELNIAVGGWGSSSWKTRHLYLKSQPGTFRSPEVLIEAPWDESTVWWNFGAVVHEAFTSKPLFSGGVPPDGHYELKMHLAEIVNLFGPFPKELLERGNRELVEELFDSEGRIKSAPPLSRPPLSSETFMPALSPELSGEFASFLKTLMKINPSKRLTFWNVLRHPFVGAATNLRQPTRRYSLYEQSANKLEADMLESQKALPKRC